MPEIKRTQTPITNPELIMAIDAMKKERNQKTETVFINQVKGARFIVPANVRTLKKAVTDPDGTVELREQPEFQIIIFNSVDNRRFLPLFTDFEEFHKWKEADEHQAVAFGFNQICDFCENNRGENGFEGVAINPYSHNILVPTETLDKMRKTQVIAPGTEIKVGDFREPPRELIEALQRTLPTHEAVQKCYLRVMKREDKPQPNVLFVLDIASDVLRDQQALRALFDAISADVKPYLNHMEFMIAPTANDFGAKAIQGAKPVYEA